VKDNLAGAVWRFGVFAVVCLLGIFALLAIFQQLRFEKENVYHAQFSNITGLKSGDFVRIAGVEVGKVKEITLLPDTTLSVEFGTDSSVVLTEGSRAAIRYANLIGDRYLGLEEGVGGTDVLRPGATIPLDRTEPALDLDALIGGFRPLFRALNPEQVNALSGQLIAAFEGQGATISSTRRSPRCPNSSTDWPPVKPTSAPAWRMSTRPVARSPICCQRPARR
jgi:phospholipid/cholesterol/gamma-HCH transport system substrate-binding protein